jgi:ABC-type transport system substrate-binding protein
LCIRPFRPETAEFAVFSGFPLRVAVRVLGIAALFLAFALPNQRASAGGGTLTVAMTVGDIPVTTGNPDQGFEGYRFVGYNLYDALVLWDLSKADKPSEIKPGLATSWEIDPKDHKRWIVHLRRGVKWHDGCPFTAEDVCGIFNTAPTRRRRSFWPSNSPTPDRFW